MKRELLEKRKDPSYSDEEINELAEWLEGLTIKQVFFLRDSYESYKVLMAQEIGDKYVQ